MNTAFIRGMEEGTGTDVPSVIRSFSRSYNHKKESKIMKQILYCGDSNTYRAYRRYWDKKGRRRLTYTVFHQLKGELNDGL